MIPLQFCVSSVRHSVDSRRKPYVALGGEMGKKNHLGISATTTHHSMHQKLM